MLIFLSKNVKETFEGTKYKQMLKLHQNKKLCKLGVHPVSALKSYLLFYINSVQIVSIVRAFKEDMLG